VLQRIGVLPLAMAGALAVGGFAGALVAHDRTEASDLTRAASARWTYGEAVAVATSVLPPVGAQDQNGSACHVMGKVRCWTIHADVRVLGSELSGRLRAATGLTPEVTWRYTDPRATGDAGIRTSVVTSGYRIQVEILSMWAGQGASARPTGEQSITITVNPA
jgi:hypothetical protein